MFTSEFGAPGHAETVSFMEREAAGAAGSSIRRLRSRSSSRAGATAFVFSGGGAHGALQVGALRALFEAGIRPDMLVGTSIGAWNAAWLAQSPTLAGVEMLAAIWKSLRTEHVMLGTCRSIWSRVRALGGLFLLTALRRLFGGCSSLYSDTGLRQILSQRFADLTFEDLALPLSVIAANLSHGGRAVFQRGRIVDTLLASSAIPGVFPPVDVDGALYADGGLVDGCSVETAIEMGARRIFILAIGYDAKAGDGVEWARQGEHEGHSVKSVIQRASQVMGNYQIQRALERTPQGVEAYLIALTPGAGQGSLNFGGVAEMIEHAYSSTQAYLRTAFTQASDETHRLADALTPALSA
ncbi:MAG TPA: patatin-like phospholipase family protein [Ktedonobacterales bacterium]